MSRRNAVIILVVGVLMFVAVIAVYFISQGGSDQATPPSETEGEVVVGEDGQPVPVDGEATPAENGTGESELDLPDFQVGESEGTPPDMVEVVVSLQTVPRGWQMTEGELTVDLRPAESVGTNVITDVQNAVGLYARSDIYQGQTLTQNALVDDVRKIVAEEVGPSSLIPPGFVAQAVPMDRLSGVAYGMSEGDYVDILISFVIKEIDPQFQTLLENTISFQLLDEEGNLYIITADPYGRFEELPTGAVTHIAPSEDPRRPILVSMILQNAKVIQVGRWSPEGPVQAATPTPEPVEGEVPEDATPTPPPAGEIPTPTPEPPDTLLLALLPQDQLLLKYAVEADADVDFALRGINDGQLYTIENVDFNYIKERFNIDIPDNYEYTVEFIEVTPTPLPLGSEAEPTEAPTEGNN
jgi:Flp pilus assembly protein CpaB